MQGVAPSEEDEVFSRVNVLETAFLDSVEPVLAQALAEDPYQPIDAASHFASLRSWVSQRIDVVRSLVDGK
jgi:hypothetical protein